MRTVLSSMPGVASSNHPESITQDVFGGGPPLARFRYGRQAISARTLRLMIVAMAVGWLPPLLLVGVRSIVAGDGSLHSFLTDYGMLARSLIAVPLLILAQAVAAPRLDAIVCYLRDAGLVRGADAVRFGEIVKSTCRLRDSLVAEILIVAAAVALSASFWTVPVSLPQWHRVGSLPSAASWWHEFVSLPILLLLLLGWFWRLTLWTRFLFKVSRLDLLLIPSHPDGAAGLKFLGLSLEALALPAFALGSIVAGPIANQVFHHGAPIMSFRAPVLTFAGLMLALLAGPLLLFTGKLLAAMRQGMLDYGAMARDMGFQLESRWLRQPMTKEALDVPHFSAATDLYSIVANVYTMKIVPLSLRNLVLLGVGILLPFAPIELFAVSPIELLKKLTGLLL
jgi:hypothetical protein